MSIIHDALKKVQQGSSPKTDERLYEDAPPEVEVLPPRKSKVKPLLALLCATAVLWYFGSFSAPLYPYLPKIKKFATSSFYKLIHKEELPDFKTRRPEDLVPLAQITVRPPKPISPPKPVNPPKLVSPPKPATVPAAVPRPATLNIHGIMSNTKGNVVLIDDQIYQEGDDVDGVKIIKIDLNSITITNNGREETIRVKN